MWKSARCFSTLMLVLSLLPATAVQAACAEASCAEAAMQQSPVRQLAFWQHDFDRPFGERISAAPPALVDYIRLDNLRSGYPAPHAAVPDAGFRQDLHAALNSLPPAVQKLLADKLAGIYLVEQLGSTGYTDIIHDTAGQDIAGFVVLDQGMLSRSANAWATWKENTPFQAVPDWQLQASIEAPAQDDRRHAIEYVLLHELGHVVAIGSPLLPSWNAAASTINVDNYPFLRLSWCVQSGHYTGCEDAHFPWRREVVYYQQAKLTLSTAPAVYDALAHSHFPTLYGATNPGDDFAESFASYVHVVLEQRPFVISISHDGQLLTHYTACWDEARCQAKWQIMAGLLGTH